MLSKKSLKALAVVAALAIPSVALAQAKRFDVHAAGGSRIIFESDAPLETITGVTSSVTGQIQVDPANLSTVSGRVEVPIASLRTGVDLRDEHLRGENWLNARQFPNATFEITGVRGARSLTPGQTARVQVSGRFTIHGVARDLTAPAQVTYVAANGSEPPALMVRTNFTVNLPDHGVSVPALVRLKVSDEITVRVTLRLHEVAQQRAAN
jgi:polyisoprenoid-binding protein YceI